MNFKFKNSGGGLKDKMAGFIEKNEFVDSKLGIIKISNIYFLKKEDLIGFGWKFVSASHEDNDFDRLDGDKYKQSTYIYQNPLNPVKAIRIYEASSCI